MRRLHQTPILIALWTIFTITVGALLPAGAAAHEFQVGSLHIGHPWARASITPHAKAGAAYLTIRNDGTEDDRLISIETPASRHAQAHFHENNNGVLTMRPHEGGLLIPAHSSIALMPGGDHIMMMGLTAPLTAGTRQPLTLTFEKAGTITVEISVQDHDEPAQ